MLFKRNASLSVAGLHRKDYHPPADPTFLKAKIRNRIADVFGARQIGKSVAEGHQPPDGEQYPYEASLDGKAGKAIADTHSGHQKATASNENVAEDARQQKGDATTQIARIDEQDAK